MMACNGRLQTRCKFSVTVDAGNTNLVRAVEAAGYSARAAGPGSARLRPVVANRLESREGATSGSSNRCGHVGPSSVT